MAWEFILYEKVDSIAKILMNRPEALNAQHDQMLEEMDEAFKQADGDEELRVIILGATGRHFCSGHDIGLKTKPTLPQVKRQGIEAWLKREQHIYLDYCFNIRKVSKPVIAQVQGQCVTGGIMVAAMSDIIIASEDALFINPVARFACGATEALVEPWAFGPRMAKQMLWTGDPIDAREAWRLGFVNKVVPREKLEEETLALARRIALTPPFAVRLIKRSVNHTVDLMGFVQALEYHFLIHELSHFTQESERVFWQNLEEAHVQGNLRGFFERLNRPYK